MDRGRCQAQDEPVLAETIKLSGGEVLVILLVLIGMAVVAAAFLALGCVWAWRAGRGSQAALAGWIVCAVVEGLLLLQVIGSLFQGRPNFLGAVPAGALAAQVGLYLAARAPRAGP